MSIALGDFRSIPWSNEWKGAAMGSYRGDLDFEETAFEDSRMTDGAAGRRAFSKRAIDRRTFAGAAAALCAAIPVTLLGFTGCSSDNGSASTGAASGSASAAQAGSASGTAAKREVTIGTLATEDILPMWVALEEKLADDSSVSLNVVTFQSATELIAGVSSGDVNMAMTDPMVSASLFAGGTDVLLQWVTLGETADQGRFGIQTAADSGIASLNDLAGVPIGVGSNTILEYVMDVLMADAGIPADQVVVEELQKLPVRYQAMASGQVKAAALPASLLALGESQGCVTLADDTKGDNISQSVMIVRRDFLEGEGGAQAVAAVRELWDRAAALINGSPESYRALLVEKASLPEEVADSYPISTYPLAQMPTSEMIEPVLDWMRVKGYLETELTYDASDGSFRR